MKVHLCWFKYDLQLKNLFNQGIKKGESAVAAMLASHLEGELLYI